MRAAFVVALVLLAGCIGAGPHPSPPPAPASSLPPGCDASRPALAHHADGRPAPEAPGPRPLPCAAYTGYSAGEPTLGIHPKTGSVFYYPAGGFVGNETSVGVARSKDQGATWTRHEPNLGAARTHPLTQDPYFYLDPRTGRLFADDLLTVNCSILSWSDDEAATWQHSAVGCAEFDHQTLFAGPPVTSHPSGYPDVVYRCAINAVALSDASWASTCMKSLDGGATFVPTGEPAFVSDSSEPGHQGVPTWCDGATGHGFVGPDGTVYVPKGLCDRPMLAISHDEGLTWTRVQVSDLGTPKDGSSTDHEAGVAADAAGNVYYGWIAADRLPHLAISRDGGRTWGPALNLAPFGLKEASLGEITVAGPDKVSMVYMGSTNSPGAPFPQSPACTPDPRACLANDNPAYRDVTWNGYMTMSADALAPDPTFYTATVNDPADPLVRGSCGIVRCQEVYDFLDVRIGPDGTPWASFVDGCTEACARGGQHQDNTGQGLVGRLFGGPSLN